MEKNYEHNIKLLGNRCPFLQEKVNFLKTIDLEQTKMLRNTQQGLEFFLDKQYYKTSSVNGEEEIEFMTREMEEKRDYLLIVFDLGNVPLLRKIMEMVTPDSKILIYEPNPYLLKYLLINYDLSFLLESDQVGFIFDYDNPKNLEQEFFFYAGLNWGNLVKNLFVISQPNVWHYMEKCHYIMKQFLTAINVNIKLLGNSLQDIFNGQENNYKNIDALIENNNLEAIKDKFKGYPAIVVASGPSLDKNIDILHEAQDKALIITCDASLEACKKHQVKPDGIASIERIPETYWYYYQGKTFDEKLVLLGPSLLWPQIYEEYPGKKLITGKVNDGVEKWWGSHFENLYFLNQGMSCANVAFAYAKYAGCNPIVLVGQDLAYTENKKHSNLTHTEFEGENASIQEKDGLMTEDIYGNPILTDDIYNLFRNWFELQIRAEKELQVIDATEGGAKIQGSEIMTLREVIDKYCTKELPMHLYDCIPDKPKPEPEVYIKKYEKVMKGAKEQKRRLKKLQRKAAKHYRVLERFYYKEDLDSMSEDELVQVLLKLQRGDTLIHDIDKEGYLMTYFQQMIRQTIIFVKGLGNEITPKNVRQNIRFQANLVGVIKESVDVIIKEYDKMIAFLEEKKAKREGEASL